MKRLIPIGLIMILASMSTCDLPWATSKRDNPADRGSTTYPGYDTVSDSSSVKPASSTAIILALYAPKLVALKVVGASTYDFQIAIDSLFSGTSLVHENQAVATNEYLPTDWSGLDPVITYYWRVRASRDGSWGPWSTDLATFSLSTPNPGTTAPVNGATISSTTPTFDWNDLSGAFGYRIQVSTVGDFSSMVKDDSTLTASSYAMTSSLTTGTTYYWRVAAKNGDGVWGAFSTPLSLVFMLPVAAPVFSPAAGSYASPPTVTISTTTTGASIRYTTDGSTPTKTVGTAYAGPFSVTTSQALKAIAYLSGWKDSAVSSASYTFIPPPAPAAPSVSAVGYPSGSGQLAVSWAAATGATAYDIYYSTTSSPPGTANGPTNVAGTSSTISGLTNWTTYYIWIAAKNSGGTSSLSPMASGAPGIHVTGVSLNKTTDTISISLTDQLTPSITPANATNTNVTWTSDNTSIATVTTSGIVTAVAIGTANITAASVDGNKTMTCIVTIIQRYTNVTTLAGKAGVSGATDGIGTAALFNPQGIASDGTNLYVADFGNNIIRKIAISSGTVTTLAGAAGISGSTDGTGPAARFSGPSGITTDRTNLYVTDFWNSTIRQVVISSGLVTTLAGTAGVSGATDGTGPAARFNSPTGITFYGSILYVADYLNHTIRRVTIPSGIVTTIAGGAGTGASIDGTGTSTARFKYPSGICTDGANLYISEQCTIREMNIVSAVVSTLAGTSGISGSSDGTGSAAQFSGPQGIITDSLNLYVSDTNNHTIRKIIISSLVVSTLAGNAVISGSSDGIATAASFVYPWGIVTDGTNIYIADEGNYTIRKMQ